MSIFSRYLKNFCVFSSLLFSIIASANETIRPFPLNNYNQDPHYFFNMHALDYNTELFDVKTINEKVKNYKEHLFGKFSPWSEDFVTTLLNAPAPDDLKAIESEVYYSKRKNCDTPLAGSYGENFKTYTCAWFDTLFKKMDLEQFNFPRIYHNQNKAIATANVLARMLPTNDPIFGNPKLPGEGYPFDNLQVGSIWIGTPLYVLGQTKDKTWSFVTTASGYIAWVPSSSIAYVQENFIAEYLNYVQNYGLRIIKQTEAAIYHENIALSSTAYVGSIFPGSSMNSNTFMIPTRQANGFAQLQSTFADINHTDIFPLAPTKKNFVEIFNSLRGRPYGWGGMHFYNDCSQELQSIFIPFGIWLPRNSADQVNAGIIEDLSHLNSSERLSTLATHARPLTTLIYIKGHIMLYVGNYEYFGNLIPTVYNNMWGMRPADNSYRAVIGQSAFFPLLESYMYPEDRNVISLADSAYRPVLKISFLDQLTEETNARSFKSSDLSPVKIDLRKMIYIDR